MGKKIKIPICRMPMETVMSKGLVSILAYHSVGDGLIYLQLAEFFKRNGYDVTLYSDLMCHLQEWVPTHRVKPLPKPDEVPAIAASVDLLIADYLSRSLKGLGPNQLRQLGKTCLLVSAVQIPDDYLLQTLSTEKTRCGVTLHAGCFIEQPKSALTTVDWIRFYAEKRLSLDVPKRATVEFCVPDGLEFRSHPERVVIAPESPDSRKNWYPNQFIELAVLLKKNGYEPVFAVAPSDRERWVERLADRFELTETPTLHELACCLYESGAVIANDSGCGHVASFLGVPVLTLFRRPVRHFKWRPGWGPSQVVGPILCFRFRRKRYWQCFLSPARALKAFNELMNSLG
jgi:heptosyltransferase-3